jgi:hypothetical protein
MEKSVVANIPFPKISYEVKIFQKDGLIQGGVQISPDSCEIQLFSLAKPTWNFPFISYSRTIFMQVISGKLKPHKHELKSC